MGPVFHSDQATELVFSQFRKFFYLHLMYICYYESIPNGLKKKGISEFFA